jgi:hypothetical protein
MKGGLKVKTANNTRKNERKCDIKGVGAVQNINAQPFAFVRQIIKMPSLPPLGMPHHVQPNRRA